MKAATNFPHPVPARPVRRGRPVMPRRPGVTTPINAPTKAALLEEADSLMLSLGTYIERILTALEPAQRIRLATLDQ